MRKREKQNRGIKTLAKKDRGEYTSYNSADIFVLLNA